MTTQQTHAPGPWWASEGGFAPKISNADGVLAEVHDSEDTARLIAAAPELLAALTTLHEHHDAESECEGTGLSLPDLFRAMMAARDAIAKATGD